MRIWRCLPKYIRTQETSVCKRCTSKRRALLWLISLLSLFSLIASLAFPRRASTLSSLGFWKTSEFGMFSMRLENSEMGGDVWLLKRPQRKKYLLLCTKDTLMHCSSTMKVVSFISRSPTPRTLAIPTRKSMRREMSWEDVRDTITRPPPPLSEIVLRKSPDIDIDRVAVCLCSPRGNPFVLRCWPLAKAGDWAAQSTISCVYIPQRFPFVLMYDSWTSLTVMHDLHCLVRPRVSKSWLWVVC